MIVIDAETLHTMARQHGVIRRRQLIDELGWSSSAVARARRAGLLVEIAPGVLHMASDRVTFETLCMAAQLRSNNRGFLSGWTAGRLYGLRQMPDRRVHLTVPQQFRSVVPSYVELHRSGWFLDRRDVVTRPDGLRVATPMRMLFGLAAAFNQFRFERAAEDAWHLHLVTPTDAAAYLDEHRCRGKDGDSTIERWLERCAEQPRPSQSGLELDLLAALEAEGLQCPDRQRPLMLPTGETIHIDIAWPEIRLGVEPGASWWHGGDLRQRHDQDRDRSCGEIGWQIVRFDDSMRRDITGSARQVVRIHRRRTADLRNLPAIAR